MKTRLLYFLVILCTTNLSAQLQLGNFPRVYYPQVYFNKADAENSLEKGTSSIKR